MLSNGGRKFERHLVLHRSVRRQCRMTKKLSLNTSVQRPRPSALGTVMTYSYSVTVIIVKTTSVPPS